MTQVSELLPLTQETWTGLPDPSFSLGTGLDVMGMCGVNQQTEAFSSSPIHNNFKRIKMPQEQ